MYLARDCRMDMCFVYILQAFCDFSTWGSLFNLVAIVRSRNISMKSCSPSPCEHDLQCMVV